MTRPTTLLFDIDHTLAFDNRLELTVLHSMCEELEQNVPSATKQGILRHFDASAQQQFERIRQGTVRLEDAITEQFRYLATQVPNLDPQSMALSFIDRVVEECKTFLRVAPGATALLRDLREAGYVVAVLTNGWERLQREKVRLIGFDGPMFVSDTIGYWKPDVRAFQLVVKEVQADPTRTLYVGDSPSSDVRGSKNAGLGSVWVNWEGEPFPDGLPRPDHEVRHLDELRAVLAEV